MKPTATDTAQPTAAPGRALALRRATRARHCRVDRLMDLHRMANSAHDARALKGFDAFLGLWEAAVSRAQADHPPAWLHVLSRHPQSLLYERPAPA